MYPKLTAPFCFHLMSLCFCAFICILFLAAVPSTSTQPQYAVHEGEHTAQDEHDDNDTLLPSHHVMTPTEGRPTPSLIFNWDKWTLLLSITMPCWEKCTHHSKSKKLYWDVKWTFYIWQSVYNTIWPSQLYTIPLTQSNFLLCISNSSLCAWFYYILINDWHLIKHNWPNAFFEGLRGLSGLLCLGPPRVLDRLYRQEY